MNMLQRYVETRNIKDADAAKEIGCGRSTFANLRRGARVPSLALALQIQKWSEGKVPVESWPVGAAA